MKLISLECKRPSCGCNKRIYGTFNELDADIFCLQETKLQPDQISELPGYEQYWNSAVKKGYMVMAVFTRIKTVIRN